MIQMPAPSQAPAQAQAERPQASPPILLACRPELHGLASVLTSAGHRVLLKSDGRDVLVWLRENTPALLVLDARLEGLGGLDICYRTKKVSRLKGVPVALLFAAEDAQRQRVEAHMAKADAQLTLPLPRDAFLAALAELLPALTRTT